MSAPSSLLTAEAVIWLGIARFCITALPFRWVRAWLCCARATDSHSSDRVEIVTAVAQTIEAVCLRAPVLGTCLPQAMAASAMLRLRRIACCAHFGVITPREGCGLEAHVWVTAGDIVVTGGALKSAYVEIGKV